MKYYLHIGYPKNFSTSLQRSYFSVHEEIYHLGIGNDSNISYRDELTASIFEVYLKTAKRFKYEEEYDKIQTHLNEHKKKAMDIGSKAFGVSSEHFSFSFTYECLDFHTKMERAVQLLGNDLHIIMVIREQMELLRSLYRESVRVGLIGSYEDFIYNHFKFQDRNYYYDLRYDLVYDALSKWIAPKNIHVLPFEEYRDEKKQMRMVDGQVKLVKDLSEILGLNYLNVDFNHHNEALSDSEIIAKSQLNPTHRHDLGNNLYSTAEIHRQATYFSNELNIKESETVAFKDVIMKRKSIAMAKADAENFKGKGLYECDPVLLEKVRSFYRKGNAKFCGISNIALPETYLQ